MRDIGIFHWFGYVLPAEERFKLIKAAGFDYVMLWWEDETFPEFIDKKDLVKMLEHHGLKLDNIHLPYENINLLWSTEDFKRLDETDTVVRWMNECRSCGATTAVLHTTRGNQEVLNKSRGYDSFSRIIKAAEDIKLKVAFENTQMTEYLEFIFEEVQSPYAGFCYDSSHDFVNGQSFGTLLDKWKDRLFAVHLSDNDGKDDRHWVPGKGHVRWDEIMSILKETDIKSFSMEVYPYMKEKELPPAEFLKKAREGLLSKLKGDI